MEGPEGVDLIKAAVDTTMDASIGSSYTAFDRTSEGLAIVADQVALRLVGGRACPLCARGPAGAVLDLQLFVGRLGFDQLDPARAAVLEAVPDAFPAAAGTGR